MALNLSHIVQNMRGEIATLAYIINYFFRYILSNIVVNVIINVRFFCLVPHRHYVCNPHTCAGVSRITSPLTIDCKQQNMLHIYVFLGCFVTF